MKNKENTVKVFKALCDEQRLTILEHLQDGEKCVCVLTELMNMAQSKLSYHLKILCESGIVMSRQEGKFAHYSIHSTGAKYASDLIIELTKLNDKQIPNAYYLNLPKKTIE